jgi:two-component system, cell cycle sensor histidine kinase and response regulator CckA
VETNQIDRLLEEIAALRGALELERARAVRPEAALDRAQWLASMLEHSPDTICILDRDGYMLYLNRTPPGRELASYVGRKAVEFMPQEGQALWQSCFDRAWASGQPQQVEIPSTEHFWWNVRLVPIRPGTGATHQSEPTFLLGIGTDVTERKRAEQALALKDQQLRVALEGSGMGQWQWDLAHDRGNWDQTTRKILGLGDVPDLNYKAFLDRVHPEDRRRVRTHFERALATGECPAFEHRVHLPDGTERWVLLLAKVVMGESGKPTHLLGGLLDISQERRGQVEKQRAQKLEALGQLAGGVAHDFNNLLVAIMGNIQIASSKRADTERAQFLNEALSACSRAAELTKQLLAFGRRQHIHEHPLDVHAMLDDTLRLLRRLVPETIAMELLKARKLPRVLGDRGQLEQVIVNLCINGRDAMMPGGGRLVLETEQVVINGKFRESHPWARPGRYVLISVSDTGSGIPPENLDRIFEPFFTTKEMGTGLGLSSAYGVVKQHGGLLHVYSEPDNGTTFKVYLPVAERDAAEVGPKIEEPVRGGTETILLAEDEAPVRRVVKLILSEAGYRVIEAANGAVAVDLFKATPDSIDLVLLDAVMPEKSGSQAAAEIHAIKPDIALVLSSGYSDVLATDPTAIADLAFLAKPYEPDTLLRVVRRVLDSKHGGEA